MTSLNINYLTLELLRVSIWEIASKRFGILNTAIIGLDVVPLIGI